MEKYNAPDMEIIDFTIQDIVTLSVDIGSGENLGGDWES